MKGRAFVRCSVSSSYMSFTEQTQRCLVTTEVMIAIIPTDVNHLFCRKCLKLTK